MHTSTLPRHPRTGVLAAGWRKARPGETGPQPVWPIRGGSTPPTPQPTPQPAPPAGDPPPPPAPAPAPPAGDPAPAPTPGKPEGGPNTDWQAEAEKWKALSRKNEEQAKANSDAAKRLAEIEEANKTEAEKLADRAQKAEERAASATRTAVAAKVEALAAATFEDTEDAVGALDPAKYVDSEGRIDAEAIKADLTALLERKPHWAKNAGAPRTPRPDPSQGPRPGGQPGSLDDQIREAQAKRDWRTVLSLQNSKLAETKPN